MEYHCRGEVQKAQLLMDISPDLISRLEQQWCPTQMASSKRQKSSEVPVVAIPVSSAEDLQLDHPTVVIGDSQVARIYLNKLHKTALNPCNGCPISKIIGFVQASPNEPWSNVERVVLFVGTVDVLQGRYDQVGDLTADLFNAIRAKGFKGKVAVVNLPPIQAYKAEVMVANTKLLDKSAEWEKSKGVLLDFYTHVQKYEKNPFERDAYHISTTAAGWLIQLLFLNDFQLTKFPYTKFLNAGQAKPPSSQSGHRTTNGPEETQASRPTQEDGEKDETTPNPNGHESEEDGDNSEQEEGGDDDGDEEEEAQQKEQEKGKKHDVSGRKRSATILYSTKLRGRSIDG